MSARVVMFGVPWCPHCVAAREPFSVAQAQMGSSMIYVDAESVAGEKLAAKFGKAGYRVSGYPTFLGKATSGDIKEFSGQRTAKNFINFFQECQAS